MTISTAVYASFTTTTAVTFTPNVYTISHVSAENWYVPPAGYCDVSPLGFTPVTQTSTTFYFVVGTASTFTITPFSAHINCGSLPATITYSGTMSDYSSLPAWITIDPTTGSIIVSAAASTLESIQNILVFGILPSFQYTS